MTIDMAQIDKDVLEDLANCIGKIAAEYFQDEEIRKDFEAWQKERQSGI